MRYFRVKSINETLARNLASHSHAAVLWDPSIPKVHVLGSMSEQMVGRHFKGVTS